MKLAIIHDWLKDLGGAERVLIELHHMYPQAPIYTLFYDKKFVRQYLPNAQIRASFLQGIPFIGKIYSGLVFLMPVAIESFDFSKFDKVLSSSVSFSKGLVLKPATQHICYCYSPTRFLWDHHIEYGKSASTRIIQHIMRLWDKSSAERVDRFVAISNTVQNRIKKYYQKEAQVIYPPITLASKTDIKIPNKDYYLIVSRLYKHKNIDIAIKTFNKLGYRLIIIGDGPEKRGLAKIAGPNIYFLGRQDDAVVIAYYQNCNAFIMPQEEDFGLTPIEAMSFGKPVIALRKGGATETLTEGVTGELFDDPIPEALADAITRFKNKTYDSSKIVAHSAQYSREKFQDKISALILPN